MLKLSYSSYRRESSVEILFYVTSTGASPVKKYIQDLPQKEREFVAATFTKIEELGIEDSLIRVKKMEGRLWEIIIRQQRVFYVLVKGPAMVLPHAYKKQSQKAPKGEIRLATNRMKEYLEFFEKGGK